MISNIFKNIEEISKYIVKHQVPNLIFKELKNCKKHTDKIRKHKLSYLLEHHNAGQNSYQVSVPFNLIEGSFLQSYLIYLGEHYRCKYEKLLLNDTRRTVFMRRNENHFDSYDLWINYTEKNSRNILHNHQGNLSGVIYFTDCEGSPIIFENNFSYDGKKGDVLIFPSAFKHRVERHNSKKPRISFAFNLEIKGVIKV